MYVTLWTTCFYRMKEVGMMDGCEVLRQAIQACPRRAELYYFAARLELSRTKPVAASGIAEQSCSCTGECDGHHLDRAVEWLVICVKAFYAQMPEEQLTTKQVLILYRYHLQYV